MEALSKTQIKEAVDQWVDREHKRLVSEFYRARFQGVTPQNDGWFRPEPRDDEEALAIGASWDGPGDFALEALRIIERGTPRDAARAYREWTEAASDVAQDAGLHLTEMSSEQQELMIRAVLLGYVELQKRLARGKTATEQVSPSVQIHARPTLDSHHPPTTGISLCHAWDLYCAEMKASGAKNWQEGAPDHAEWAKKDIFELFDESRPIASITRENLVFFRDVLQTRYPVNRARSKPYRELSLAEIAAGSGVPEEKRIGLNTRKSRLQHVKGFFKYARAAGHRVDDPSDGISIKQSSAKKGKLWSPEEVRQILGAKELHRQFLGDSKQHCPAGLFWLVAVLAYTGARLREIMALRFEDFVWHESTPIITIQRHEARGLKNEHSGRWVPIHKDLLSLGLKDWIEWRARNGAPAPWPSSTKKTAEYWGRRFREAITIPLGLHEHRGKMLHSFRHTFISTCVGVNVPDSARHLMTGHKGRGVDWNHYIHQRPEDRQTYTEYVNRITYGLDLEKLEGMWRRSVHLVTEGRSP